MSTPCSDPILVHVGFPKALSSWLQKHLFHQQYGFVTVLEPVQVQLQLIDPTPFAFDPGPVQEALRQRLAGASPGLVPVITSEALSGNMYSGGFNGRECIDRVLQVAPNARLLLLVREQRQLIRSLYKSLVTWGMPHSVDRLLDPVEPRLAPQFNLDFLRFDQRVAYYQQQVGAERVLVMAYESFDLDPVGFLRRLGEFAGLGDGSIAALDGAPHKQKVNRGQTLANLYLQRLANRVFLSGPFNYSGLFRPTAEDWEKRIRRSKRNPLPGFMDDWFEDRFANKVRLATEGAFGDSNRRLQELTGLDLAPLGYEV